MAKKLDKVDVVIVGSGWAGGITAAELTKEGYKVVILERGHDQKPEDFIGAKDELRYVNRRGLTQDLTKETMTSRREKDEEAKPVRTNANNVVGENTGGASAHWSGVSYRWQPYDFEIYSKTVDRYGEDKIPEDMTIQDWGITYDDIEPYYDQFEKTAGISGEENPLGPERSSEYPNPPMKETPVTRLFKETTEDMGYHPYHMPSANITEQYENPDGETINACVYCAFCTFYGCDFGAKADPLITVLPTAKKTNNLELRNGTYVTRVLHDDNDAKGLLYVDTETGEEFEQPADLVVLAGFVFANTRLLLLSEIGTPYDPETGKGVIGKNYTGHHDNISSQIGVRGFFEDQKFNVFMGAGALGATIDDFSADNLDHEELDFLHGFEISGRMSGNAAIANNHVPPGTPMWGKEFKEKSLYYANRNLFLTIQTGVLPRKYNYMDLDPNYKDAFGDPLLRVTNKYTDQDRNLTRHAAEKGKEIMENMGADIISPLEVPDDLDFNHSYTGHFAGGVIMGNDPDTSAVNNYSQMWDMENLFVVGSSSFPHMSNYNPTLTIGAFAYRAVEGMIEYLENDGGGLLVEPET